MVTESADAGGASGTAVGSRKRAAAKRQQRLARELDEQKRIEDEKLEVAQRHKAANTIQNAARKKQEADAARVAYDWVGGDGAP